MYYPLTCMQPIPVPTNYVDGVLAFTSALKISCIYDIPTCSSLKPKWFYRSHSD